MYTDIDFEYHSHLSTTINNQLSLHMLEEDIGTDWPIHNIIYSWVLLNPHALHGKSQPHVSFE